MAANTEGKREIVGLHIGPSEAETFWATFLKGLVRRGLHGIKLVISDAHEGLKAAIRRVVGASWQRCRVHWMRNAQSYVPKGQQSMVAAALRQAFIQPDRSTAAQTLRHVADQLRAKWPKLGAFIDESETDVLAHMDFPAQHRTKIHSTNPLERLNKEVKRRADVVGIFPNEPVPVAVSPRSRRVADLQGGQLVHSHPTVPFSVPILITGSTTQYGGVPRCERRQQLVLRSFQRTVKDNGGDIRVPLSPPQRLDRRSPRRR